MLRLHLNNLLGDNRMKNLTKPLAMIVGGSSGMGLATAKQLLQQDIDVIIMLRLQKERMNGALLPSESEYYRLYGLTRDRLKHAKSDAIVMHPGPINRGVEIESEVADGEQSVILDQVTNGIAIRMAVMSMAMSGQTEEKNRLQVRTQEENAK